MLIECMNLRTWTYLEDAIVLVSDAALVVISEIREIASGFKASSISGGSTVLTLPLKTPSLKKPPLKNAPHCKICLYVGCMNLRTWTYNWKM